MTNYWVFLFGYAMATVVSCLTILATKYFAWKKENK